MTSVIDVRDVSVRYRPFIDRQPTIIRSLGRMRHRGTEIVALDGISFSVRRGEAFGIIGSNGAGKSTLVRVMAGTLPPDDGTVTLHAESSALLSLGLGFNRELSGERNIYLGGLAAGMTKAEIDDVYTSIVEFSELGPAIRRPIKTYSSGMRSRLAFSLAMFQKPEVLLLDEVLAVGDEAFQRKGAQALKLMLESAGAVVLVSHALARVRQICQRVLWIEAGKVQMIGPADEVIDEYAAWVRAKDANAADPIAWGPPWSAQTRMLAVLRLLEGDTLPIVSREVGVSAEELDLWRWTFLSAGKEALKEMPPVGSKKSEEMAAEASAERGAPTS